MPGKTDIVLAVAAILACLSMAASGADQVAEPEPKAESGTTAPRMRGGSPRDRGKCYSMTSRRMGREGRIVVTATVEADGSVTGVAFPPGVEKWQRDFVYCLIEDMQFIPAERGGIPIAAKATLPIAYHLMDDSGDAEELIEPKLVSRPEEIEEAYRVCYPPDMLTMQRVHYRVTVDTNGQNRKMELVESSGDKKLDQAGLCMLGRLRFDAGQRGGVATQTTIIVPLLLRPPR